MSNNRLSEYFAEIEAVAKKDRVAAIKLQNEHLKVFMKAKPLPPFKIDTDQNNAGGFNTCYMTLRPNKKPYDDAYSGGFFCIDGKAYDDEGYEIDFDDDEFGGETPPYFD